MVKGILRPAVAESSDRASIRRTLLGWYDRNKRDLPWRRREADPYAQWVAEIMLQQTRVETVAAYYDRFLRRFPTLESLARADHDAVLKYWEGLGYYRRVLNLHKAARLLVEGGSFIPQTSSSWLGLPGVGAYTAAAISSIAQREPVAAVDGNVARVIARLFAVEEDILSGTGRKRIQALADQLLSRRRPGDFNQAWMDFANVVCTPRNPDCAHCPFSKRCHSLARGMADRLPVRGNGRVKVVPEVNLVAGVFAHDGRVLMQRRPRGGLWSGLWEWPSMEAEGRVTMGHLRRLAKRVGLEIVGRSRRIETVEHRLTHRRIVFHPFVCRVADVGGEGPAIGPRRWVTMREMSKLSMSTGHRKVLARFREADREWLDGCQRKTV